MKAARLSSTAEAVCRVWVIVVSVVFLLGCARTEKSPRVKDFEGSRNTVSQPTTLSKSLWKSDLPTGRFLTHTPSSVMVFDEKVVAQDQFSVLQHLKQSQIRAINENKWGDLPFHFYIDSQGLLYEGRPVDHQAPQLHKGVDPQGQVYVAFINDFERFAPTPTEIDKLTHLLCWLCNKYSIAVEQIGVVRDEMPEHTAGKRLQAYFDQGLIHERIRKVLQAINKRS